MTTLPAVGSSPYPVRFFRQACQARRSLQGRPFIPPAFLARPFRSLIRMPNAMIDDAGATSRRSSVYARACAHAPWLPGTETICGGNSWCTESFRFAVVSGGQSNLMSSLRTFLRFRGKAGKDRGKDGGSRRVTRYLYEVGDITQFGISVNVEFSSERLAWRRRRRSMFSLAHAACETCKPIVSFPIIASDTSITGIFHLAFYVPRKRWSCISVLSLLALAIYLY